MKRTAFSFLILCSSLQIFGQDVNKPQLDTIVLNGVSHVGNVLNGNFVGLWTGKTVLSDSVRTYTRFDHGIFIENYFVHPIQGPLLLNQVNNTRDTLSQFIYGKNGELLFRTKFYISDTATWRRNVFTPGTSDGESGMKQVQRLEYYYDYDNISGFTLVSENNYGADSYSHYYMSGRFVCTMDALCA